MHPIEIVFAILFILYIVLPVHLPYSFAPYVDSSLGMIVLFCITVSLFLYTNPILGVLYIFVAYELLRRSANVTGKTNIMQYTPSQDKKDAEFREMNPPREVSLEEEVISVKAPVGHSDPSVYVSSSFKPVSEKLEGASMV